MNKPSIVTDATFEVLVEDPEATLGVRLLDTTEGDRDNGLGCRSATGMWISALAVVCAASDERFVPMVNGHFFIVWRCRDRGDVGVGCGFGWEGLAFALLTFGGGEPSCTVDVSNCCGACVDTDTRCGDDADILVDCIDASFDCIDVRAGCVDALIREEANSNVLAPPPPPPTPSAPSTPNDTTLLTALLLVECECDAVAVCASNISPEP